MKKPKKIVNDIICPYCMKKFPANGVNFTYNLKKLENSENEVTKCVDKYIKYYTDNKENDHNYNTKTPIVIDTSCVKEADKIYDSSGMLIRIRDIVPLTDRVCPYCHNKLNPLLGQCPTQFVSFIGKTSSGKSTFMSSLMYQLQNNGFSCINYTDELYKDDIANRIALIKKGQDYKNEENDKKWMATSDYTGPYIYELTAKNVPPFSLIFYDLPGEKFSNIEEIKRKAPYISVSQTCVFFIDLDDINNSITTADTIFSNMKDEYKRNNVNIAVVLYKGDLLSDTLSSTKTIKMTMDLSYNDIQPIDMNCLDVNNNIIIDFIKKNSNKINTNFVNSPYENIMFFVAQTFSSKTFLPKGCDVPILWSLAKQGIYPTIKEEKK